MPTSRARKGRLVARLKKKQKHALAKKTHLGPSKSGCLIQSRSKKDANALTKIITYLRFALGRHDFSDIVSLTRNEECARKAESDRIEVENKVNDTENGGDCIGKETDEEVPDVLKEKRGNDSTFMKAGEFKFCTPDHSSLLWHPLSVVKRLPSKLWKILCLLFRPCSCTDDVIDLRRRVSLLEQDVEKLKCMVVEQSSQQCTVKHASMSDWKTEAALQVPGKVIPPPLPPPPPPPPPPPLLPPPPLRPNSMKSAIKGAARSTKRKVRLAVAETCDKGTPKGGLCITNDQLSKVKLRKITAKSSTEKTDANRGRQIITLKDLNSIKLRKTSTVKKHLGDLSNYSDRTPLRDVKNTKAFVANNQNGLKSPLFSTPFCAYNLRKSLKKVDLARSPGGTPLVKTKRETGVGLTPLLSAALKRKFENVQIDSLEISSEF